MLRAYYSQEKKHHKEDKIRAREWGTKEGVGRALSTFILYRSTLVYTLPRTVEVSAPRPRRMFFFLFFFGV